MSGLPFTGFVIPAGGGGSGSGGVSGLDTADGGTALADNVIVRGDGTTGIQGSLVTLNDSGSLSAPAGQSISFDASSFSDAGSGEGFALTGSGSVVARGNASGLRLAGQLQLTWASGSGFPGGYDVGLKRVASSTLAVTDASSGIGALLTAQVVEANTDGSGSPNVLTATESNKILTNEGSAATNYHTLPSAVAGLVFTFAQEDSTQPIRVVANTGDIIAGPFSTAAAGYYESGAEASWLTVAAINADRWQVISIGGVWTDGTSTYDDAALTT